MPPLCRTLSWQCVCSRHLCRGRDNKGAACLRCAEDSSGWNVTRVCGVEQVDDLEGQVRELTAVQHDLLLQLGPSRVQVSLSIDDAPAFTQPTDDSSMVHQSQGSCEQEYEGALSPQSLEVSSCFPHQARARLRQGN